MPSKEEFYSLLRGKQVSDKKHDHILNIWNKFEIKTVKEYHDLYLKCYVWLSADVLEKFKNNSLKNYPLCPSH